jgi:pyruvate dehydrogenase E2 component (dihydrolipoamide acetyltransferase)
VDIVVPKVGLTVEHAEVLAWLKAVGDEVVAGEPLVELAADKVDLEIVAPGDGVLADIAAQPGQQVSLGEVIGRIGDAVGSASPGDPSEAAPADAQAAPPGDGAPPETPGNDTGARISPVARRAAQHLGVDLVSAAQAGDGRRIMKADVERLAREGNGMVANRTDRPHSSPAARRLAEALGVALEDLTGTGPGGRIVEADVTRGAAASPAPVPVPVPEPEPAGAPQGAVVAEAFEEVRWTAARRMTARRMTESVSSTAPVTLHRRVDAGWALAKAKELKARGVPATFTHVLLEQTAGALTEHPDINTVWDGERLLRSRAVHLGVAVDADGLFVPVVRDAATLGIEDLVSITAGLVAQCRARTIPSEALQGSTFSVSNLGMLGVEQFTPIINPPHVAILGVGTVVRELVPTDDGFAAKSLCHLSLTFDHRAVDGAPAARFLATLAQRLAGGATT